MARLLFLGFRRFNFLSRNGDILYSILKQIIDQGYLMKGRLLSKTVSALENDAFWIMILYCAREYCWMFITANNTKICNT